MKLKHIKIANYRCFKKAAVDFDEHITLVVGKNGAGKSSLLKMLVGEHIEHSGTVSIGSGLVVSYVQQDTSDLEGSLSKFAETNNIEESLFKAILRKLDFSRI